MKKFSASTLDKALLEASSYFNCSLTQLEYEIVQNNSDGIFGLFKKDAIIIATRKQEIENNTPNNYMELQDNKIQDNNENEQASKISISNDDNIIKSSNNMQTDNTEKEIINDDYIQDDKDGDIQENLNNQDSISNKEIQDCGINCNEKSYTKQEQNTETTQFSFNSNIASDFDDVFYDKDSSIPWQDSKETQEMQLQTQDIKDICEEIQKELYELLAFLPLDLNKVQVSQYDDHTLFILIDGVDAALLIGQKGYRYKSLSYLLFNWINTCYGYNVRLEIAQFLKNQEDMIRSYLEPIIESAKINGKAQTKPLDGVLTHIAIKILRDALPNKYIVFRDNADGEKYITISDFLNSNNHRNNGFGNIPKY